MLARVTFLGHSTVLVELGGIRLLTDPVLFHRVSILRRVASPLPASLREGIDGVVISHLHHDHLDLPSLAEVGRDVPLFVPRGAGPMLRRHGFARVTELVAGDEAAIGPVRLTATHAEHPGFRMPLGPRAPALGFVIEEGTERVYFAGDTDLFDGMAELRDLDLALLPVWGWGPRLGRGHMDPRRAAEALLLLRPRIAVPIHWGTLWPYGMGRVAQERLAGPPVEFAREAALLAPGVQVLVTPPTETVDIPR